MRGFSTVRTLAKDEPTTGSPMARTPIGTLESEGRGSKDLDVAQQTPGQRPGTLGSWLGFHPRVAFWFLPGVHAELPFFLWANLAEGCQFFPFPLRQVSARIGRECPHAGQNFFRGLIMTTTSGDDLTGLLRRIQAEDPEAEPQLVATHCAGERGVHAGSRRRYPRRGT